jgi:membrane-associated phospholipid phosphatase
MMTFPTPLDFWLARLLAEFVGRHSQIALAIESGMRHTLFGGFWFGAALFVLWVRADRAGQAETRRRILTILAGSAVAVLLTVAAGALISWPPPIRDPSLKIFYPPPMLTNLNTNCFPSQSTAAYGAVAAGIYSLHRVTGWVLWILVLLFVALPRMLTGGHYFTDILAGAVLALLGYAAARHLLEAKLNSKLISYADSRPLARLTLQLLMFVWIVQVTVEFREVIWAKVVFDYFFR